MGVFLVGVTFHPSLTDPHVRYPDYSICGLVFVLLLFGHLMLTEKSVYGSTNNTFLAFIMLTALCLPRRRNVVSDTASYNYYKYYGQASAKCPSTPPMGVGVLPNGWAIIGDFGPLGVSTMPAPEAPEGKLLWVYIKNHRRPMRDSEEIDRFSKC